MSHVWGTQGKWVLRVWRGKGFGVGAQIITYEGTTYFNRRQDMQHVELCYERKLATFEDASRDNITWIIYVNSLLEVRFYTTDYQCFCGYFLWVPYVLHTCCLDLRYVGVIWFILHVVQPLAIRFIKQNPCCIVKPMMKHLQKPDWNLDLP